MGTYLPVFLSFVLVCVLVSNFLVYLSANLSCVLSVCVLVSGLACLCACWSVCLSACILPFCVNYFCVSEQPACLSVCLCLLYIYALDPEMVPFHLENFLDCLNGVSFSHTTHKLPVRVTAVLMSALLDHVF